MKSTYSLITIALAALFVAGGNTFAQESYGKGKGRGEGVGRGEGTGQAKERRETIETQSQKKIAITAVTESVNVTLTTAGGKISVRGWDRNELRVQTKEEGATIELHKASSADSSTPSQRVEVLLTDKSEGEDPDGETCYANADVMIDVPRGATLFLKTEDGDIDVEDVGEAHVDTSGGRIDLRRISKATDAKSVGGDITLENSSGRARLSSIGGLVGIRDLRPQDPSDFLKISTVSGDVLLEQVGIARVEAKSISGIVKMVGSLARGGNYGFTTTIGDITLVLGQDSSFKLNARVSEGGEIITDFQLKYKGSASPFRLLHGGRVVGDYGSGDAALNIESFSGTVRLRKR